MEVGDYYLDSTPSAIIHVLELIEGARDVQYRVEILGLHYYRGHIWQEYYKPSVGGLTKLSPAQGSCLWTIFAGKYV